MSTTDLQDVNVDIDVAGPEDYVDNTGPGLLPEGFYNLILKEYVVDRDPVTDEFRGSITLRRLEVADGPHQGRFVNDLRIWTTPFERNGVKVSQLGDLLRGIAKERWSGLQGACDLLDRAIDQQIPIRVKLKWEAYDRKGFEQEGGLRLVRKSPEEKALRKRCTVSGMRKFPQLPDGSYRDTVEGPVSGESIQARLVIDRVEPVRG